MCRSTVFGRLHAHHQQLTTALTASLWFYRWSVGGSSVVGRVLAGYNRPEHDQQHCYYQRSNGKTRGCYCSLSFW